MVELEQKLADRRIFRDSSTDLHDLVSINQGLNRKISKNCSMTWTARPWPLERRSSRQFQNSPKGLAKIGYELLGELARRSKTPATITTQLTASVSEGKRDQGQNRGHPP